MEVYRDQHIEGVGLSPHKGFKLAHLGFLSDYPDVIGVALPYSEKIDIGGLAALRNLRYLSIAGNRQELDLGAFKNVEELRIDCHAKLRMPPRLASVRELLLRGYKADGKDLSRLPECPKLTRIELVQGNVEDLEGIQRFSAIESAEFSYLKALKEIAALKYLRNLTDLRFATCKRVADYSTTRNMRELRALRIIDCGEVPSISFLNEIPKLEEFRFVKTKVMDGDMSALLRLKKVGFLPSKKYTHTPAQVEATIRARAS
jgi:hypothetical protein